MAARASCLYEFGLFRLDPAERRLLREGRPIALRAKIFDTLCILVEAHGRLVDKEELIRRVWPEAVVEEGNLAHNVSVLRKTLGEPTTGQKYVETVPGRGYRFVGHVREIQQPESGPWHEFSVQASKPALALVQRRNELERLDQCLERALGGTRQVVFISGEAGIGKTALEMPLLSRRVAGPVFGMGTANVWTTVAPLNRTCRCWRRSAVCAVERRVRT